MAGYAKEFLIDAYMFRYAYGSIEIEVQETLKNNASRHYDLVGKDKFRIAASLDAEAIKKYKLVLASK